MTLTVVVKSAIESGELILEAPADRLSGDVLLRGAIALVLHAVLQCKCPQHRRAVLHDLFSPLSEG